MKIKKTILKSRMAWRAFFLTGIILAAAADRSWAAFPNNAGRIWVGTGIDTSFSAASSSSWIPGSVPNTNSDLYIGTSTASGGTNVISCGTATTKAVMACHGMTFNNNFNSSNSITIGSTGNFPIGIAMGTNAPVPAYIETLMTSGTIRFQTFDPTNVLNVGNLTIRLGTNLIFSTSSGSTIQVACLIDQTNWAGLGAYTIPYSIIKTNAGTLSLLTSNAFGGGVTLYGGTLNVATNYALGAPSGTFAIYGGTLDNISGSALTLQNYPINVNGDFTFTGSSSMDLGTGAVTLSGTRRVTVSANTLTIGGIVGPSSGGNGLTKAGSGTLTLNAAETYNGNTTISAGTLALGASASIANSPNITVNGTLDVSAVSGFALGGSQTLQGSGVVNGSVGTASGSEIIPGTDGTTGTLTLSNSLSLASGATCNFDLSSTAAGANDLLVVNGSGTALTLNGNSFVIKASSTLDPAVDYTLVSVPNGTISGTFNSTPTWSGTPPANAASYSVITSAHTVTLHYTPAVVGVDHYVVTPSVSSTNAGKVFTAVVQAYNNVNAPITDSSVDGTFVVMSSSGSAQFDANGDGTYGDNIKTLTNGTVTINVTDLKAESVTLTASTGLNTGTSASISITPGALTQLQLLLPGETATPGVAPGKTGAPTTRTAGSGFSVTVNAVDANWNVVSTSDTIHLSEANDANAILPANTALSSGTATLGVTNILAGSGRTLTATDVSNGGITASTSPAYAVVPGAVAKLVIVAPGESFTLGAAPGKTGSPSAQNSTVGYSVTVDALDAQYNLVTNATDTVGITTGIGGDTLPANAALVGGTKTFALTNNTVGSATLTASDVSNGGVTAGTSAVTVNINSTTTVLASSINPANAGQSFTLTATVSGAGKRTGTVTFKNGTAILGTSTLSANAATFTLSGGLGTYSLTAVYNGDSNNTGSTSSALSQVIQTGGAVVGAAALMEDGQDYAASASTANPPVGRGPWGIGGGSGSTSYIGIYAGDLSGATSPDIKPLPNTVNPAALLQVSKAASAGRYYYRNMSNSVTSGSVYFSFLMKVTVNPTLTDEFMGSVLALNGNTQPAATDPLTFHARKGADTTHFDLGIERLNGTTSWTSDLVDNTTYLIVVKYTFGSAASCSLYVNPTPGGGEPAPTVSAISDGVTAEPANIGAVLFFENTSLTSGTYQYDVMRADTSWATVTPSINSSSTLGAAALALSPGPQSLIVNSNSALMTVTLLDQSNNVFTATSDTTVNLSSSSSYGTFLSGSDGTTVISSVVISNGTNSATFYYNDASAGNPTITASSGLLTPASQTESVNPPLGLIGHLAITPSTSSTSAGTVFTATVQAYDTNNMAITDSRADGLLVTLTSSGLAQFDANGDATYGDNVKALTNGTLTINARDLKAESVTLSASLGTFSANSSSVSISAGLIAKLQLLMPGETATPGVSPGKTGTPTARTAGSGYSITVNAVDANWNVAASSDTVQITAANDANAILPGNTALSAGTATLSVTNIIAGSGRTLTATDVSNGGITASTSPSYNVVAGAVARLVLMAPGESPTYNVAPGKTGTASHQLQTGPFTLTVNAMDANYNLVTTASDTVQITSTDGGATLPANGTLSGGVGSFSITHAASGSVTDTATDVSNGGVTAGTTAVTVDIIPRFRTAASGNWASTSTWEYSTDAGSTWNPATGTPSSATTALTELTSGKTVTVAANVSINRTTVDAGAAVSVPSGIALSVVAGAGTDLDVFGVITNAGVVTNVSATVKMESGSAYYHNQDGGSLPVANWNVNSTCDVVGWVSATTVSAGTQIRQKFGNFTWNSPAQTSAMSFGSSVPTNFAGNFNVVSTGSGSLALCIGSTVNLDIGGDLNISGGTLYGSTTGSGTEVVNVGGNVNLSSGTLNLETSLSGTEVVTWNLSGDLNVSGGTLTATTTNSVAAPTINFVKAGTQKLALSGGGQIVSTNTISWMVTNGATLDLGTNVLNGNKSFAVAAGSGLITAHATGFKGNLNLATVSLSTGGKYTYDGVSAQSADTLLPETVAGLTVNNNGGLSLNQSTTATNLALVASPVSGNLTVPNTGSASVDSSSSVSGNLNLNHASLTLNSSNAFPQLTMIGGTLTLNGGNIALVVRGAAIAEGTYLLVDTASGGAVSGTLPPVVNISGTALPSSSFGVPQIIGGKLYVNYQKFFGAADSGPGFFSGENLVHDDVSGRTFSVWSTSDLSQPVSGWTYEGSTVEFPIVGSSPAMSHYGITVTPSASPMYYVLATTNVGPFSAAEPLITLTTDDYVTFNVGVTNTMITSGGVFQLTVPVVTPVLINTSSAHLSGGAMTFSFTNSSGLTFTVLATNNLAAARANWPAIGTAAESPSGSGHYQFTDPAPATNGMRFYLLRQP
jgi:autotransporter-associated beta strand protein